MRTMRACAKRTRPQIAAAVGTAAADCQDELSQIGSVDFIDEYGDDPTDSLDRSMDECVAEGVDAILNPNDQGDETTDDPSVPQASRFRARRRHTLVWRPDSSTGRAAHL